MGRPAQARKAAGGAARPNPFDRLEARTGEKAFAGLLIGVPAVVIGVGAWVVTGNLIEAAIIGFFGSCLLMVGLMAYFDTPAKR